MSRHRHGDDDDIRKQFPEMRTDPMNSTAPMIDSSTTWS